MQRLQNFTTGSPDAISKLNNLIRAVRELQNFSGDGIITAKKTPTGYVIGINFNQLITRMPDSRKVVRKAYCKTDAGAGTTLACYLDSDDSNDEVTVNFNTTNGTALNACLPPLSDGDMILVINIDGDWWCTGNFFKMDFCS